MASSVVTHPSANLVTNVKMVTQNGKIQSNGPFAHDERSQTPRLSVYKHANTSVRCGDHFTQISPAHAHVPPPSPRGGTPTVHAARACVRCGSARCVGYAPLRPSCFIHVLYSARRGGKTDAVPPSRCAPPSQCALRAARGHVSTCLISAPGLWHFLHVRPLSFV